MPKLRRLSGKEIVSILSKLGFEIVRIKGSHYRLEIALEQGTCGVTIPVHSNQTLSTGMIKGIYDDACICIGEDALYSYFYS
jgi:predicted RNA binding protein YcfA (HicA-like mRNA interferase family)